MRCSFPCPKNILESGYLQDLFCVYLKLFLVTEERNDPFEWCNMARATREEVRDNTPKARTVSFPSAIITTATMGRTWTRAEPTIRRAAIDNATILFFIVRRCDWLWLKYNIECDLCNNFLHKKEYLFSFFAKKKLDTFTIFIARRVARIKIC